MWTPDAYEGAPTPATTFMSVVRQGRGVRGAAARAAGRLRRPLLDQRRHAAGRRCSRGFAALTMVVRQPRRGRTSRASSACWRTRRSRTPATCWSASSRCSRPRRAAGRVERCSSICSRTRSRTCGAFGALILCGSHGAEAVSYEDLAGARPAPSARRAAVLALRAVADGLSADRGLLRQVVRLQRRDRGRRPAGLAGRDRRADQRGRRVLLPARARVHVHERAGGGRPDRGADALGLRRGGARRVRATWCCSSACCRTA